MTLPRTLTRTALRAEVALLRAPLWSIDRMITPLLGRRSIAHRSLATGMQTLDAVTDRLTGERGHARSTSSEVTPEESTEVAERTERYLEAQEEETFVGELADADLRRAQAEVRARQDIEDEHRD